MNVTYDSGQSDWDDREVVRVTALRSGATHHCIMIPADLAAHLLADEDGGFREAIKVARVAMLDRRRKQVSRVAKDLDRLQKELAEMEAASE